MANTYVKYITDEHLMYCIGNLINSYLKANISKNKQDFYKNKIDPIKFTFDQKFFGLDEKELIAIEVQRQITKSITNAIGIFHEEVLGGITGYERGVKSKYDIKASDNTLFADLKNKHNTMNSSSAENLYQALQSFANQYPDSRCYWVAIWATQSYHEPWKHKVRNRKYEHKRVFKISGDRFYALLSGHDDALYQLYKVLPKAIDDYLKLHKISYKTERTAYDEILAEANDSKRSILNQMTLDNFPYYLGFDKLK